MDRTTWHKNLEFETTKGNSKSEIMGERMFLKNLKFEIPERQPKGAPEGQ
jgi:hypothetical protein